MAAQQPKLPVVFNFDAITVRTFNDEGEIWFAAADVCAALDITNPRNATARLDDDEKDVHSMDTPGGKQDIVTINESGLYSLILTSRKAEAKKFKRWVTHDVLPSIRQTGSYEQKQAPVLPQPATITPELHSHINRKANAVALRQYETIRSIITEAAQSNMNCGASEEDAHRYIENYGDGASDVTIINNRDLFLLAHQTTGLLNDAGRVLETIHNLEKHLGRELYLRKKHGEFGSYGLPESLVEQVLKAAKERAK